jgi:eukaryotic-like serine/threonine-protein kinase
MTARARPSEEGSWYDSGEVKEREADPEAHTICSDLLEARSPGSPGSPGSPPRKEAPGARATSPEESPQLLAGRYALLGMLGAGAMGTVYRAHDRELDEVVALKVLKEELASAGLIERFRREVKLARRVTHKNVARTYDIGEHAGDRFLTMEFVEGEMLGALLARRGRLRLKEVVRLGLDVCAGLSAAHAANVLHRDLKPENVIVAKDGRAVITDFGIARAAHSGDELRQTVGIVGTPAYMAPEQVEGAADLDARADLYALGAMLYELLTGEMAWQGDSIVTVAAGRLLKPPPDPRSILPTLSPEAAALVLKLMARQRDDRFASADETADALRSLPIDDSPSVRSLPKPSPSGTLPLSSQHRIAASAASAASRSLGSEPRSLGGLSPLLQTRNIPGTRVVVVLPVLNLGASDDVYLVDSVNEDIVDLLSVVQGLLVRPRGDTARYIDNTRDVREIGRSLGADVVVDGSLRRVGEIVRASFRLIAVEDGFQLWARRFDRPPAEVLSIADDAAQAIAKALTAELTPHQRPQVADPEAEELYLRGRFLLRRTWVGSVRQAIEMLRLAKERSPDDPRILSTYSLALARVYGSGSQAFDGAEYARSMAKQALGQNPSLVEAKVALATIHLQNGESDTATGYLRDAVTTAPNSVDALETLGRILGEIGRVEEGIALLERAAAVEPDYLAVRIRIARLRGIIGDEEGMKKAVGAPPTHPGDLAFWFISQARHAMWMRKKEDAARLEAMLGATELPQDARFPITSILNVTLGRIERLTDPALLDNVLPIDDSRPPRQAAFNAQLRAELFASAGDYPRALQCLKAADGHGFIDIVFIDRCPLLAPLRNDPEFLQVREHVALRARRVVATLDPRRA